VDQAQLEPQETREAQASQEEMVTRERPERQARPVTTPPTAHARAELALLEWLRALESVAISSLLAATRPRPLASRPKLG
jgi:hypothetical protein